MEKKYTVEVLKELLGDDAKILEELKERKEKEVKENV